MLAIQALIVFVIHQAAAQTYSATYLPTNVPDQTEQGQTGTNRCGSGFNQTSMCQNAYINSVDDFCLWAPPEPGNASVIGNTERIEVAWCIKEGYGTRLIPDGAVTGAHFVKTPDFVQITGVGNLTLLNIPSGDLGGELDPHGADGNGNPVGGLVFSSAFGDLKQMFEWTNFMGDTQFCFRACNPAPNAPTLCQHVYDEMGCAWNMPASYDPGVFEKCQGNSGEPMGVYGGSTFHQGDPVTPSAHPPPGSSNCQTLTSIGNGVNIVGTSIVTSVSTTGTGTRGTTGGSSPTGTAGGASSATGSNSNSAALSSAGWDRVLLSVALTIMIGSIGGVAVLF